VGATILNTIRSKTEKHIEELEASLRSASESLLAQTGRVLSVLDLRLQGDYTEQIVGQIRQEHSRLMAIERSLAEKRSELIAADRAVKSIETLRDRFQQRARRDEMIEEQKLADEIAHRKFAPLAGRKIFPR
jgi:flagellar export protein FliJ